MKRLNAILVNVFEIEEDAISDELSYNDVDAWDSLNTLLLVTELENEFKVKFTMDEVASMKDVKSIKAALIHHGVSLPS